jgi:hypothetical protein|tara:strand:+ start:305 stop:439 length:135 start_codon:yes stop_codon:yes gene_type:complete
MIEIYGASYGNFVRRTFKYWGKRIEPPKKSEKKVEKGLDFVPKV